MKKGFTLIEIIAVITILGIIGLISVPVANKAIKNSKNKMYKEQEERIITACKNFILDNDPNVYDSLLNSSLVFVDYLKEKGYLPNEEIIDPRDNSIMDGAVIIQCVSEDKTEVEDDCKYVYEYDNTLKKEMFFPDID